MTDFITVYSAEMLRRLQSRTFWVGLVLGLAGVAIMMRLPAFLDSYTSQANHVMISGDAALVAKAKPMLAKDFPNAAQAGPMSAPTLEDLEAHNADAVIALARSNSGLRVTIYAKDPSDDQASTLRRDLLPLDLQMVTNLSESQVHAIVKMPINVHSVSKKFGTAAQADTAKVIAYVLLVLLYILIMVNSQLIMSSVAEEKTSRIAELLVASVKPTTLLSGKVAASGSLAILQMIVWVASAYAFGMHAPTAPSHSGDSDIAMSLNGISPADVAGFVVFFIVGFLQMATLFAAFGSLINRTEDLGSVGGPLFLPVIAAFFIGLAALEIPDSPGIVTASFIPLVAPFVMFARIVVSSVPIWQVALSFAINAAAIWLIAIAGGKIYRLGMLLYGRPPKLSQIAHLLRS